MHSNRKATWSYKAVAFKQAKQKSSVQPTQKTFSVYGTVVHRASARKEIKIQMLDQIPKVPRS